MPNVPFLRSPYNYDMSVAGDQSGLACEDCSLTIQSMAAEADINLIVKRAGVTGEFPTSGRVPLEGDFDGVYDFHSAQNAIREAQESFNRLPAAFRARFDNDPQHFMEFAIDPANRPELVTLGLIAPGEGAAVAPSAAPVSEQAKPAS